MAKKVKKFSTLDSMLAGIEKLFLSVIIGLVFPILLGLAGWWSSIPFVPEKSILYFALGGFMLGVLVDLIFLRFWTRNAFHFPLIWPALVYLFYSVGMFGFFMGVPVFNLLMGLVGGYFMGMRLRAENAGNEKVEQTARQTGIFTAFVLAVACVAALTIAGLSSSLEGDIRGMFALANPMSKTAILALSSVAGIGLVILEYAITLAAVRFARFEG
jgi:hypothetical protein